MSEQIPLTVHELQHGVQLLLEHYRRSGLTHVPSHVDPPRTQAFLSAIRTEIAPGAGAGLTMIPPSDHDASSSVVAPQATRAAKTQPEHGLSQPPSPAITREVARADATGRLAEETAATAKSIAWSLPVLSWDARQTELDKIDEQVKACKLCSDIAAYRHQTVFGDGTLQPTICFFGEAPGADEDREGKPFVGKAGQLLNRIIEAMTFKRSEVYILNALKCRPPQNRTPVPDEIDNCRRFVEAQLDILQPKFIVCLGAVAVRSLLQTNESVGRLRGRFHQYRASRVVVTYHPAYLLRNETAKKFVWEDMQMLLHELGLKPGKSG